MAAPTPNRAFAPVASLLAQPIVWVPCVVLAGSCAIAWAYWRNPGDLSIGASNRPASTNSWQAEDVDLTGIAADIDVSDVLVQQLEAAALGNDARNKKRNQPDSEIKAGSAEEILKRLSGPVAGPVGERPRTADGEDVVPDRIFLGTSPQGDDGRGTAIGSLGSFRSDGRFVPSNPMAAPPRDRALGNTTAGRSDAPTAASDASSASPVVPSRPTGPLIRAYDNTTPSYGGGSSTYGSPAGRIPGSGTSAGVGGAPGGRLPASSSLVPPVPAAGDTTAPMPYNRGARDSSSFAPPAPAAINQGTRSASDSGAPAPGPTGAPNNIGGRPFNSFGNPYGNRN